MKVYLEKIFRLEAAHWLPHVPEGHKCRRMHGHSFVVEVTVAGDVDPKMGWMMDYGDIAAVWKPLHAQLDHRCLNEIEGLENPTSENLCLWLWQRLQPQLPGLYEIVVRETCASACRYRGE